MIASPYSKTMHDQAETANAMVFTRVLVGVDGSAEGIEAALQAASLLEPAGALMLVSAYDVAEAVVGAGGMVAPVYSDPSLLVEEANEALEAARSAISERTPATTERLRGGRPWEQLLWKAKDEQVSAIAVGTHGKGRLKGILLGSTATELIHKALSSVLIARPGVASPPATIVVGVDGSPESRRALQVARHLSTRFGARLWPVVAHGGHGADAAAVAQVMGDEWFEQLQDEPVTALVAAGADADLVVVGSRGLHGFRALGSVSEQVAHEAPCSVLIVR